ncbi:MAG: hypothetical protein U0228_32170 [Myxococcaceae bacterium]
MRALLVVLVLALGSGCPGGGNGPCTSPEVLFPAARATATSVDAGMVRIDVRWQVNASVPDAFYAQPLVSGDARLVDAGTSFVELISTRPFSSGSVNARLEYFEGPARSCQHIGMDDTYVLEVSVPVPTDGGTSTGTIKTDVQLGAL